MEKRNFIIPEFGPLAGLRVIGAGSLIGNNDGGFRSGGHSDRTAKDRRYIPKLSAAEKNRAGNGRLIVDAGCAKPTVDDA